MPSKNSIKIYAENGFYHLYNRGVAKNLIFLEDRDYAVFLSYLREYLSPPQRPTEEELRLMEYKYFRRNYLDQIELLSYCLMPNHFHLLLRQKSSRLIEGFMRSLLTRYSAYFNKHYQRVGHLFQGVYKGVLVSRENYFLWLSRYIHRNPIELLKEGQKLSDYSYSSYPVYLGRREVDWVKTKEILGSARNYKQFVEREEREAPEDINDYVLESREG